MTAISQIKTLEDNSSQQLKSSSDGMKADSKAVDRAVWIDRAWKILVLGVLYCYLFREELLRLVARWGTAKDSHGLLIPAFSMYFLYQDRARLRKTLGKSSYVGLLVILGCVAGYVYSVSKSMFYPRQVMMIGLLLGVVLLVGGWRIIRIVWLPIIYLLFAMPLPARLYYNITMPLRVLASTVAAAVLGLVPDLMCEASGVLIHGTYHGETFSLNVAEACSGMRLLLAFVALGVAMAYLEYRPVVHRVVLLISTIPIAIFCNVLRVFVTGMVHIFIGPEYARGTLHTIMGMVMLGVAFALYGLLAWIMNRLVLEEDEGEVLVIGQKETGSEN